MNTKTLQVTISVEPDALEEAKARAGQEKFKRNIAWLEAHAAEVYSNRGKFYCISEAQAFVAETVEDAVAQACAAHPDDDGRFTGYIPKERAARIYAH